MGDPNPDDKARKALLSLRQTTSVKSYADEFQRLITYLPDRDPADLRFDFINGLKPKIRELLVGKTSELPWQDVRDLAYRYDDLVMSNRLNPAPANPPRHARDNRPSDPMELGTAAVTPRSRPATPYRGRSTSRSVSPVTSRSSSPAKPLPKLTEETREKLRRNNGCFRCQQYNAGHIARDCPGLKISSARVQPTPKN